MPICQMKTNYRFTEGEKKKFSDEMASKMAKILEKPIQAVMVMLSEEYMYMNQSDDTVFFAEFRYLKDFKDENQKKEFLEYFADEMLAFIIKYTSANPYRVYMQFTPMTRDGAWRYIEKKDSILEVRKETLKCSGQ